MSHERTVVWFSAGAPSAVTAKLTLAEHGHDNVAIAYTNPGSEHPDNERFLTDCEAWFDHPVIRLHSERYADTWDVWTKRRYLVGPTGALCTTELKKMIRFLDQLDPNRGSYKDEDTIECSLLCVLAEDTIELGKAS